MQCFGPGVLTTDFEKVFLTCTITKNIDCDYKAVFDLPTRVTQATIER